MKLTSKQRAYLNSLATNTESILSLGKSSLTPEFTQSVSEALDARELVKITVLKSCTEDLHTLADTLADRTQSEVVQVIGRKIILYKEGKEKNKKIELP